MLRLLIIPPFLCLGFSGCFRSWSSFLYRWRSRFLWLGSRARWLLSFAIGFLAGGVLLLLALRFGVAALLLLTGLSCLSVALGLSLLLSALFRFLQDRFRGLLRLARLLRGSSGLPAAVPVEVQVLVHLSHFGIECVQGALESVGSLICTAPSLR
ncbi:hypothetical protein AXW87_31040 [Pseudomonas aeruginosa]|uniref:Uncharacterized protein n=1 Tax=Pseudomonas citronellolis TaxID=53408 RepID=A0A1A9KMI1_9PSED|nr:hypothetical protein A9C11_32635 [Pseudomonas citronellolis]RIY50658.1 hypothetical protein AXW87_31040 [Pseudomonas aeruginosa]RIY57427.1 hypothetical protein AXW88_31050 [Pseudomonas aeruginosa]RPS20540.1 hypothetical protein IPC1027_21055 [Pseudomonas aeruginosa]